MIKAFALLFTVWLTLTTFAPAEAALWTTPRQLDDAVAAVNQQASRSQGAKVVTERLTREFSVTEAQVQSLRSKGLGFGEVGIVLSLASKLPGGITDANVKKVLALRETNPPTGWGRIARNLDLKLGRVVKPVREVAEQSQAQLDNGGGKEQSVQAKADWSSRADRPEKPEKPQWRR